MKYNIYIAENIWTKAADGNYHQNTLSLKQVAQNVEGFSTGCWPIIENLKKRMVEQGAWEGVLSRSETWCIDHLTRYATKADTQHDDMFPSLIGIDIITTPFTLTLKSE